MSVPTPPGAIRYDMPYRIFFRDINEYNFAVAACGGPSADGITTIEMAPRTAGAFFGIPFPYPSGDIDAMSKGVLFGFYTPGMEFLIAGHTGVFVDDTVDTQLVNQVATSFGTGPQCFFVWTGWIQFMGSQPTNPDTPTPIPQRRWIGSLDFEPLGQGGLQLSTGAGCREAGRVLDAVGFAIRGQNTPGTIWNRRLNEYGFTVRSSWERFYFRPRVPGTITHGVWRCHNSVSPSAGAGLQYNTAGNLELVTITSLGVATVQATIAVTQFTWYKIDVILSFPSIGAESGRIRVWLNGTLVADFTDSSGGSLDTVGFHQESDLGRWLSGSDNQVEYDLCDWINAEPPTLVGAESLLNIDFLVGSHVRGIPNTQTGTFTGWTNTNIETMNQMHNPGQQLGSNQVSTTALATLDVTTDLRTLDTSAAFPLQDMTGINIGPVAAVVGMGSLQALGGDGTLGYSVAGSGFVMATVNQGNTFGFQTVLYNPTGNIIPADFFPLVIRHVKTNDATSDTVSGMQAAVEFIGGWGPEDFAGFGAVDRNPPFLHNCRYPYSPWGLIGGGVPQGTVYIVAGTYVGNGLRTVLSFPAPVHFLWIRPLSAATDGVKFFGASTGAHRGTLERVVPNYITKITCDAFGQALVNISGTDSQCNANAVTFQYVAFCDPGARFNLCGAYNRPSTLALANQALPDPNFLAVCGFIQNDILGNASSSQGMWFKGPGNTGNNGNTMNGAIAANFGTFSTGFLNSRADIHPSTAGNVNYSLWRPNDGNCGFNALWILSYTGNGAGSQVINLTPTFGKFPCFVLVVPTNASASFYRDPSHTANNSANASSLANSTTAITAAAQDQITVGSSLNANGVVYNVFAFPGDAAGFNNGVFALPECAPTAPLWSPPPLVPPEVAILGDGGLILGDSIAITILKDVSGLYTLQSGKTDDTVYNRTGGAATTENRAIPNPSGKTGFISG